MRQLKEVRRLRYALRRARMASGLGKYIVIAMDKETNKEGIYRKYQSVQLLLLDQEKYRIRSSIIPHCEW